MTKEAADPVIQAQEGIEPLRLGGLYGWWARRGWPASYAGKLWLAATVCLLLPLGLAYSVAETTVPERMPLSLALGGALGVAALGLVLRALTAPVREAERALSGYLDGQARTAGDGPRDAAGELLARVRALSEHLNERGTALGELAPTDYLTGLPNRTVAMDRLGQSLNLAHRDHLPITLAILDVDDLVAINETYGGSVGDRLLAGIGHRLSQLLRGSDWAARGEADSFLLVLYCDVDGSRTALERILLDVCRLKVVTGGHEISTCVTAAAAQALREESLHDWFARVDGLLEEAKKAGVRLSVFE